MPHFQNKVATTRTLKDYILLFFQGMGMGTADAVPGVSGGTMALIFGIYTELVATIKAAASKEFWQNLVTGKFLEALELINWRFLLTLLGGIFIAIVVVSSRLEHWLSHYPSYVWAFFFGLVSASVITVSKHIKQWSAAAIILFLLGALLAFLLVGLSPAQTPNNLAFIMLCGAIAICALILPGISGSLILVILGKYHYMISAIKNLDILKIIVFALGALIGLLSFSRLLNWLLKYHYNLTLATLTGFMLGSLRKLWPWQVIVQNNTDEKILNVWPTLSQATFIALGLMLAGFALVMLIDSLASRQIKTEPKH